ncbi:hypothetical protein AS9A_2572 [Hoyosella subflava DQS3-9A1]|uniref:Uncharacterized protein n=1 Tax=Hoyosella subflava (strain DSM 45089 / JCM 17490 / NBRC 109087 / DQS3-9A1) TaxID=443218 RepID=F6EGG6_HOYSD|nr:hypothetical protein AS9A_2572 [Hoyosella subflava DQS3-9A1]
MVGPRGSREPGARGVRGRAHTHRRGAASRAGSPSRLLRATCEGDCRCSLLTRPDCGRLARRGTSWRPRWRRHPGGHRCGWSLPRCPRHHVLLRMGATHSWADHGAACRSGRPEPRLALGFTTTGPHRCDWDRRARARHHRRAEPTAARIFDCLARCELPRAVSAKLARATRGADNSGRGRVAPRHHSWYPVRCSESRYPRSCLRNSCCGRNIAGHTALPHRHGGAGPARHIGGASALYGRTDDAGNVCDPDGGTRSRCRRCGVGLARLSRRLTHRASRGVGARGAVRCARRIDRKPAPRRCTRNRADRTGRRAPNRCCGNAVVWLRVRGRRRAPVSHQRGARGAVRLAAGNRVGKSRCDHRKRAAGPRCGCRGCHDPWGPGSGGNNLGARWGRRTLRSERWSRPQRCPCRGL